MMTHIRYNTADFAKYCKTTKINESDPEITLTRNVPTDQIELKFKNLCTLCGMINDLNIAMEAI